MATSKPTSQLKKAAQDDSIMGTNNSSIVSKRSVEKLYYPEPHYFRYFVKKFQRRSPVINRGYWLRMYVVEKMVERFLQEPSKKRKIILNLGCGYDPLPFQWIGRRTKSRENILFVDVDYPQLMKKKVEVILEVPQLHELLENVTATTSSETILLRSDSYLALGCDLRDLAKLESTLSQELETSQCLFLVIAEVSVTYMDVNAADALIAWVGRLDHACFCLLEQYLPNGADHPFAQTMLKHFDKLRTPLKSVHSYPRLEDQEHRFRSCGWTSVLARSFWELWNDDCFLSAHQRLELNNVEAFDEWEELALFASHYFLLVATKGSKVATSVSCFCDKAKQQSEDCLSHSENYLPKRLSVASPMCLVHHLQEPKHRRYGAVSEIQEGVMSHHGGQGPQSRLQSAEVFALEDVVPDANAFLPLVAEARTCHTITNLNDYDCLLVGGRTSPDRALADCWYCRNGIWNRVEDLPNPLYRHSACFVDKGSEYSGILIYGGRSLNGAAMNDWLVWQIEVGWRKLKCIGDILHPRFGATISPSSSMSGVLLGGMSLDGTILQELWEWSLVAEGSDYYIAVKNQSHQLEAFSNLRYVIPRFGACAIRSSMGLLLIGGISAKCILPDDYDILLLRCNWDISPKNDYAIELFYIPCVREHRPLLTGHSSVMCTEGSIVIVGGGAVCFSFGTFWNIGVWSMDTGAETYKKSWCHIGQQAQRSTINSSSKVFDSSLIDSPAHRSHPLSTLPRLRLEDSISFERVLRNSKPVIIEGLDLGSCVKKWTAAYLKEAVGSERLVVIHEASSSNMDFQSKNFKYLTVHFGDFIDSINAGAHRYLRSLASEMPADRPAEFAKDYPTLARDFLLPQELQFASYNSHSSVLRLAGAVQVWLHYDVMANVLCQIRNRKRLFLYPPADITRLGIPHGASSSSLNIFDTASSHLVVGTHPHEAILNPGDVLFIPPLWCHAASPADGTSVAVNVFFRNLTSGYAPGRDVYGNRDLQAYEKGRKDIEKIAKAFQGMPPEISQFYTERLAMELQEKALSMGQR